MFFHLSINHYAPVLIRFWFGFGAGKKEGLFDGICYGFSAPKSCDVWGNEILCGDGDWIWVRGMFSAHLNSWKRPWLSIDCGLIRQRVAAQLSGNFWGQVIYVGVLGWWLSMQVVSGLMARLRRGLIIVCISPRNMLKPELGFRQLRYNHCKLGW